MKLLCKVNKKPALIIGFCQGHKSKVQAVVITNGRLESVALKDIELNELPDAIKGADNPIELKKRA